MIMDELPEREMNYNPPIMSRAHFEFCRKEAEHRYDGKLVIDDNECFIEDDDGRFNTDAVLRAMSLWYQTHMLPELTDPRKTS